VSIGLDPSVVQVVVGDKSHIAHVHANVTFDQPEHGVFRRKIATDLDVGFREEEGSEYEGVKMCKKTLVEMEG
jgi:hypothetical protein